MSDYAEKSVLSGWCIFTFALFSQAKTTLSKRQFTSKGVKPMLCAEHTLQYKANSAEERLCIG